MTIQIEQLRKPNTARAERLRLDTFTYMFASKTPCADRNAGIAQSEGHESRKPAAHDSLIEEWKNPPANTEARKSHTWGGADAPSGK